MTAILVILSQVQQQQQTHLLGNVSYRW